MMCCQQSTRRGQGNGIFRRRANSAYYTRAVQKVPKSNIEVGDLLWRAAHVANQP
jgi:hypothetical protein